MIVKNVSYEPLEAVKEDTKSIVSFLPMEAKEVSEEDGKWFIERYGPKYMVEVFENKKAETVEEELVENVEVEKPTETKCSICGKVCRTASGLNIHMRSHQ